MPPPAHNKEPVWFYPRDSKEDGVCYYIRDGRQRKNYDTAHLAPHPSAATDPIYKDMVFLRREPFGDKSGTMGDLVKDWYAPRDLIDPLTSVQTAGAGYQSSILFARGTAPPDEDTRIDVLGQLTGAHDFTVAWVDDPDTTSPGPDFLELTIDGGGAFNGDEVYLKLSVVGSFADLTGSPAVDEIVQIVRHISSTVIHIAVPYNASWSDSGTYTGEVFEACYILSGVSDSESAPGVLNGLFHTRTFNYALALPQDTPSYDDELYASVVTEQRIVPSTWSTLWAIGYPSASSAAADTVIGYAPRSKLTSTRSKRYLSELPPTLPIEIPGEQKVQIPRILKSLEGVNVYAWAEKGAHLSYNEDWTIGQNYWGPANFEVATRTDRYFRELGDIQALLTILGTPLNLIPESLVVPVGWGSYWAGSNVWARAGVRNVSIGPALADGGTVSAILPSYVSEGGIASGEQSGGLKGGETVTFTADEVPWAQTKLWAISRRQSRWGYWIIDALYVTLPAKPY